MSSLMSPGMHPVVAALRTIEVGLDELAEANLWSLLDSEALEVRVELERVWARLYGARLASTREVETRGAAVGAGATSSRAWLINRVRLHPGEATRELLLAAALDQDLPVTAAALAAGEIGPGAVAVIADTDRELAKFATAAQRSDAEAALAGHASVLPVQGLQHAALHLRNRLDPDQGDRLAKEEEAQVARREFRLRSHPDGSSRPDGYLDKEATAFLRAALDPLAKPARPPAERPIRGPLRSGRGTRRSSWSSWRCARGTCRSRPANPSSWSSRSCCPIWRTASPPPPQAMPPAPAAQQARRGRGRGVGRGSIGRGGPRRNLLGRGRPGRGRSGWGRSGWGRSGWGRSGWGCSGGRVPGWGCWATGRRSARRWCAGGRVTARSSRWSWARTGNRSTSGVRAGTRPRRSAAPWTSATAAVRPGV
jgi:Domain of unknown function (DUF222)